MTMKRLLWQLYPVYLAITLLALIAITVYAASAFEKLFFRQTSAELEHTARLVGQMIDISRALGDRRALDALCKQAAQNTSKRITVILPSGEVIGDSEEELAALKNHADRPEVKTALGGQTGVSTRRSQTLGLDMIYVAVPLVQGGRVAGVVRAAMPEQEMAGTMRSLYTGIVLEDILLAILVAVMLLILSRRVIKPLEEIRLGAMKFLEGDLSWRLRVRGSDEVKSLASTMNLMAGELEDRMARLKHLENIRREFVANVSHELKTPVTSIRGFAETLRDEAISDPDLAKKYLDIIVSQARRLSAIIEDLLQLSRIEEEDDERQVLLEPGRIKDALAGAVSLCEARVSEKRIRLALACDEDLEAPINAPLMEQAVANLIDNAITYSEPGSEVAIDAAPDGDAVRIRVRDEGCGIPAEHLPRIFERFYRVDKGRSRKQGGTGLGLAIVKHIVGVHGGEVSVESTVGRGSIFTITLPRPDGG